MNEISIIKEQTEPAVIENQELEFVIIDIPSDVKYLDTLGACLRTLIKRMDVSEDESYYDFAIRLAVHEACANIIEHAYRLKRGRIKVVMTMFDSPRKIEVEIFDQGEPALLDNVSQPNLEEPQVKGYGLYLIQQLVDEFIYSRDKGTNLWRLVKVL